jgi:hypothetical protein
MEEYSLMFRLSQSDLRRRILGCGDGPASFNAEMANQGVAVVSCDPIYLLKSDEIQDRFEASIAPVMAQVYAHPGNYVWAYHRNPDELLRRRRQVMRTFAGDFRAGAAEGRYVAAALPDLPFPDKAFDLAICSHFLFLYSNALDFEFHRESVLELCRVAEEVRIFPLTALDCEPSAHVPRLAEALRCTQQKVEVEAVDYQFQRNGNAMMRISQSG